MTQDELLVVAESLKNLLVARATGGTADEGEYRRLRQLAIEDPRVAGSVPRFVKTCRSPSEFWGFIQPKFPTYQRRRAFIRDEFESLLAALESSSGSTAQDHASKVLKTFNADAVDAEFQKMLLRAATDPGGAVTSARTLLETVCKHILDDLGEAYESDASLPSLHGVLAAKLGLAPSQHQEKVFKQTLGGCFAVVEGIGAIRNALGDAHGRGRRSFRPLPRHAQLVVNLASSAATFLIQTWQDRAVSPP